MHVLFRKTRLQSRGGGLVLALAVGIAVSMWTAGANAATWPGALVTGPTVTIGNPSTGTTYDGSGGTYTIENDGGAADVKGGVAIAAESGPGGNDVTSITVSNITVLDYATTITANGVATNAYGPVTIYGNVYSSNPGLASSHHTLLTGTQAIRNLTLSDNTTTLDVDSLDNWSSAFGGGARIGNMPNLALTGGSVTGNKLVIQNALTNQHANGGGMSIESEWTSSTTIDSMVFSNNSVTVNGVGTGTAARGGALLLHGTNDEEREAGWTGAQNTGMNAVVRNALFSGNSATNNTGGLAGGGAVNAWRAVNVTFENVRFTGNSAAAPTGTAQGGAARLELSDHYGGNADGTLSPLNAAAAPELQYYARFAGAEFAGNSASGATAEGGAIWTDHNIQISGSTLSGNYTKAGTGANQRNAIHLENGANVIFNESASAGGGRSTDYDGISGDGDIIKTGAGDLDLFGDYSSLTGDYGFREGTVNFRSHTAAQDGTVTATNAANVMTVASAATVNMLDATTVVYTGNLTMADDATYGIAVDRAGGAASKIVSNGNSDIGDIAVRISGAPAAGDTYTIIETSATGGALTYSGGVNQIVATVLTDYSLAKQSNNLVLTVDRWDRISTVGITRNQRSVGDYLQNHPENALYDYVYGETDPNRIRLALDTNSGDYYASTVASVVRYDRLGADMIIDRAQEAFFGDAPASISSAGAYGNYSAAGSGFGVWAEVEGYHYRSDDGRNAGEGVTKGYGLAIGVDKLAGDWLFGAAFRYGDGSLEVDDRFAKTDINSYSGALYAGRRACLGPGVLHVLGGLNGGFHQFDGHRDSIVGAERNRYTADYDGKSMTAYVDAGMTFGDTSGFTFQPFGTAMWNGYWNDKIKEKGNPLYLLEGKSDENDWFSTTLGVRMTARVGDILAIDGTAGWRHTYGDVDPRASMTFRNDVGGGRFTVYGTPLKQNEGILGAGLSLNFTETVSLRASYDYTFGSGGAQSHEGRVNLGVKF